MPLTIRTIVTAAIPTLAVLFGIFWFRRKKKPPAIEGSDLSKEEHNVAAEEDIVSVADKAQVCNSTPHVFITQPSQPTPQEESFDITEALEKAVSESIAEDPVSETRGESDSEEESVESVVTAIEASNSANAAAPVNESDVGVIEDAATSSGSELNTPSPCDTIDKQVVVNEAVVELKSAPVETEHIEKIEVESNRSVISLKAPNSSSSSSRNNDDIDEATEDSALTNGVSDEEVDKNDTSGEAEKIGVNESQESDLSNGKLENGEATEDSALTNGVSDEEVEENDASGEVEVEKIVVNESQESDLSNGRLENGELEAEVTGTSDEAEDSSKSLSWSETIELSENNNVDKTGEEKTLDPYQTENSVKVTDSDESNKKLSTTAKSPVSASKSQGNVSITASSKYQSAKHLNKAATGATTKSPKAIENKRSPRSQHSSKGKAESRGKEHHQSGFQKKGKHSETVKPFTKEGLEENGDSVNVNGEDTDYGSQAEALPNGNSDSHSEISVDSGKASSVSETPSASSPNNLPDFVVYEFDFPSDYAGRLIGRQGKNVNQLKARTGAEISLKKKHFSRDYQICSVEGTQSQVHAAIDMMKQRFPPRQFPGITWEQLSVIETPILPPEIMQLSLPEGVSVDVIVSSIVDANHVFVQQPTHRTYSSLERLNYCMNACYTQDTIVPQLPRPIDPGVICAAPMYQGWYRAQVAAYDEENDECDIKFVDYGGYARMKSSILRQIRSDFTTLPFQATECYIAHVIPMRDEDAFAPEAAALLESMVQSQLLQAQILMHEQDGVPYIQLYKIQGDKVFFINRELVNQNVARWTEMTS